MVGFQRVALLSEVDKVSDLFVASIERRKLTENKSEKNRLPACEVA